MPSTNVIRPLRACQPQSGSETTNGVISWNRPAIRKNAPISNVKTSALATGRHIISAPTTPNRTAASQWWYRPAHLPTHYGLGPFNTRPDHQQTPAKQD